MCLVPRSKERLKVLVYRQKTNASVCVCLRTRVVSVVYVCVCICLYVCMWSCVPMVCVCVHVCYVCMYDVHFVCVMYVCVFSFIHTTFVISKCFIDAIKKTQITFLRPRIEEMSRKDTAEKSRMRLWRLTLGTVMLRGRSAFQSISKGRSVVLIGWSSSSIWLLSNSSSESLKPSEVHMNPFCRRGVVTCNDSDWKAVDVMDKQECLGQQQDLSVDASYFLLLILFSGKTKFLLRKFSKMPFKKRH